MTIVDRLLSSENPIIRYKALTRILGHPADSIEVRKARELLRDSDVIRKLLGRRDRNGRIPYHPYDKWYGAHWTLYILAELDFPPGDPILLPLRDQVYDWLLSEQYQKHFDKLEDRTVAHACQVGNALYYSMRLGIEDNRTNQLVEWLLEWQWPDGGWNSHRIRQSRSSFTETIEPIRGLYLAGPEHGDRRIRKALERAIDFLLRRKLFRRLTDGSIIKRDFVELHFPWYWHYDILLGLRVMAETGNIRHPNCREAIDLLHSKELPNGGYPSEKRFYTVTSRKVSGRTPVDFGATSRNEYNEFVTIEAIAVLKAAGVLGVPRQT